MASLSSSAAAAPSIDRRRRRSSSPTADIPVSVTTNGSHVVVGGGAGDVSGIISPVQKRYRGDGGGETSKVITSLQSLSVSNVYNGIMDTTAELSSSSTSMAGLQCGLCHQLLYDPVQLSTCSAVSSSASASASALSVAIPHVFCRQCLIAYTARPSSLPPVSSPTSLSATGAVAGGSVGFPFSLFASPFKKIQNALSPRAKPSTTGRPVSSPTSASSPTNGSHTAGSRLCPICSVPFTPEQVLPLATCSPALYKRLHDYLANTRDLHSRVAALTKQLHDITDQLAGVREIAEFSMPRGCLCTLHAHALVFTAKLSSARTCSVVSCGAMVTRALYCSDCSFVLCRGCFGKFSIDEGDEVGLRDGSDDNVTRATVTKVDSIRGRVLLQIIGRPLPPFWLDCNSPRIQG